MSQGSCLSLLDSILSMVSYARQECSTFSRQKVVGIHFKCECLQGNLYYKKKKKKQDLEYCTGVVGEEA